MLEKIVPKHGESVFGRNFLKILSSPYDDLLYHKFVVYFGLNFHYFLFLISFLVRYNQHVSLGMINLMESKPKTYKVKILLQVIMAFTTALMGIDWDFQNGGYTFDALALIYFGYSVAWILSIYLQFFEYQRNLPHAWYAHQMFWVLSFIMNCTAFGFLIYYTDIKDLSTNLVMKLKYIITHCIFIIVSLILSVMVFKYQREHP